jgi:hypothetical protein
VEEEQHNSKPDAKAIHRLQLITAIKALLIEETTVGMRSEMEEIVITAGECDTFMIHSYLL